MMTDIQSAYGEWLRSEIQVYQTYHNHKETMAWTATALFLAAGGAFLSAMPRVVVEHQCAATVVIVLASLAIAAFVIMQFDMRWLAADTTEGLRAALTGLYAASEVPKLGCNVSLARPALGFPKFVAHEIATVANRNPRWRSDAYKDRRWWSEAASYTLLLLMLCSVIMAVWNPPPREESKLDTVATEVSHLSTTLNTMSKELSPKLAEAESHLRSRIDEREKAHNNQMQRTRPTQTTEPRR